LFLLSLNLFLLTLIRFFERFDLPLLFLNGIDQHYSDTIILYTFDFAFGVGGGEQRFNVGDLFGNQAKIVFLALLPIEDNGP